MPSPGMPPTGARLAGELSLGSGVEGRGYWLHHSNSPCCPATRSEPREQTHRQASTAIG